MPTPVILPKLEMMMEEGTITRWLRREGETVRAGDPIVEVMTDKVNMELEAPASGVLAGIRAREGEAVPVTTVIAYILQPGEALPEAPAPAEGAAAPAGGTPPAAEAQPRPGVPRPPAAPQPGAPAAGVPPAPPGGPAPTAPAAGAEAGATPAARRLAREAGLDIATIRGTGPGGRVTEEDVRRAMRGKP